MGSLVVGALIVTFYLLPTIIASNRGHRSAGGVTALNIFLGWTFFGWVLAFVWACNGQSEAARKREELDRDDQLARRIRAIRRDDIARDIHEISRRQRGLH